MSSRQPGVHRESLSFQEFREHDFLRSPFCFPEGFFEGPFSSDTVALKQLKMDTRQSQCSPQSVANIPVLEGLFPTTVMLQYILCSFLSQPLCLRCFLSPVLSLFLILHWLNKLSIQVYCSFRVCAYVCLSHCSRKTVILERGKESILSYKYYQLERNIP